MSYYKGGGANYKVLRYGSSTKSNRRRHNLNRDKCEFHKNFLICLKHVSNKNNISSDISYCEYEETSVNFLAEKIYRYANQLGKFNPSLSQTLRELLSTKSVRS